MCIFYSICPLRFIYSPLGHLHLCMVWSTGYELLKVTEYQREGILDSQWVHPHSRGAYYTSEGG